MKFKGEKIWNYKIGGTLKTKKEEKKGQLNKGE